jgi:amidase
LTAPMNDLAALDATAQAELIRSGEVSPEEMLEGAIERTEELNGDLNAVIHPLYDEGRAAAAADIPDGPFKGVPLLMKDIGSPVAGAPLHMGTRFLKEAGFVAPIDGFLTQKFRAAGFIIFGKTNVPEFGILPTTESQAYGPARNPWDTSLSTGGSSGGAGAAVASGMVPVAHANDGGGSIRVPASRNGLVGLKPTRARVSEGPAVGDVMSGLTHEGVVTRTVRDTAAVLDAIAGSMPGDPYAAPALPRPLIEEVGADPGKQRIGLMLEPPTDDVVDPEPLAAVQETAKLLESLGHEIVPFDLSALKELDLVTTFLTRWAAGQAALAATMEMLTGKTATAEDFEPLTWALIEKGRTHTAQEYLDAVGRHQVMSRMLAGTLAATCDVILSPTTGDTTPELGAFDDTGPDPLTAIMRAAKTAAFAGGANATGAPAISLPMYWTEEGLPVGVMLMADNGREDLLIRLAAQLESAQPWADRRPGVFAGADAARA